MNAKISIITLLILTVGMGLAVTGCANSPVIGYEHISNLAQAALAGISKDELTIDSIPGLIPLAESAASSIPMPNASGTNVKKNSKAEIDASNIQDGYVMVKYLDKTTKALRVIVKGPSGAAYTYVLGAEGAYEVFPLSDGNGTYQIGVYENVEGNKYSTAHSATVDVKLKDEFAPFLRPNQYVNYRNDSETVKKAGELTKDSKTLMDKITAIYIYVVKNITYDKELAATVQSGYLPNVDTVLKKGKGICFDYAAVMAAMLRSQNIPTKLVIGYTGTVYHAWISTYSVETGWVDNVIYFDGTTWILMDPTFASSGNQSKEVMQYIGNGSNYTTKYLY